MQNEAYGRCPIAKSRDPFTCGITHRTYSTSEFFQRAEYLARAFAKHLQWQPNEGTPWEKVVAIFSFNTVRNFALNPLGETFNPMRAD